MRPFPFLAGRVWVFLSLLAVLPLYSRSASADAVADIIEELARDDPRAVRRAVAALVRLGDRAVPPLMDALGRPEAKVRQYAAEALGHLQCRDALPPLIRLMLEDEEPLVRHGAAGALGKIGDRGGVSALETALSDRSPIVRLRAADSLGKIGDRRPLPALRRLLGDADARVRAMAVRTLIQLKDKDAAGRVAALVRDDSPEVRREAAKALGELGARRFIRDLVEALRDRDRSVRILSARSLGLLGALEAVPALIKRLEERDAEMRIVVATILGDFQAFAAVPALIDLLNDTEDRVAKVARESLIRITGVDRGFDREAWRRWLSGDDRSGGGGK